MNYFVMCLVLVSMAKADVHYSLDLGARSKPSTASLDGTVAYDQMLWGTKSQEKPMYGYMRVGARLGGNPTNGAFVQVAPIAPLVFEVQKGYTHRFIKTASFDCSVVECYGRIERTDYIIRLLAGYQHFIFLGNAMWREIQTGNENKPVVLEAEMFSVQPGFHRFFESTVTVGFKLNEDDIVGVMVGAGEISENNRRFSSAYGVYKTKWNGFGIAAGLGKYSSDQADQDGSSAIFSMSYKFGERLSPY